MHKCSCGKTYQRLKTFQEHRALCEMIRLNRSDLQDTLDTPSMREMWLAMQELINKNKRLEKRVDELSSWVRKRKNKLSVTEWLDNNITPKICFNTFTKNIIIDDSDLTVMFDNNFIESISLIILKRVEEKEREEMPLQSFNQKSGKLFVYLNNKWKNLEIKELCKIIDELHNKIKNRFSEYRKTINMGDMETFYQKIMKIMGRPDNFEDACKKINLKLCNSIKFDLKNIVEYEFS
jgi:hypothetical protein